MTYPGFLIHVAKTRIHGNNEMISDDKLNSIVPQGCNWIKKAACSAGIGACQIGCTTYTGGQWWGCMIACLEAAGQAGCKDCI